MLDTQDSQSTHHLHDGQSVHPARLVVFAVLSVGFLIWVGFGQVEARVWVSGRLTMLDRRISSMWQYLGQNLPELPVAGAMTFVYWLSLLVIVLGTVAGLWLFLGTSDSVQDEDATAALQSSATQHDVE